MFAMLRQAIKELFEPTIPAENWANQELYNKDLMNGVSVEQRMQNLQYGKYKLEQKYQKPHRNSDGSIVIENCNLYRQDVMNCGAYQAQQWAKQGKYNLTPEELAKEREYYQKKWDNLCKLS